MKKDLPKISDLSPHLFWDCDQSSINWEEHSRFLVRRILELGLDNDWQILKQKYGVLKIGKIATQLRSLDPKALNFISIVADIPPNNFRCYTLRQSIPHYSGY